MWHVHSTVVHLYTWTQTTRTFPRIHPFLWGNASLKNTNTCEVANNTLHTRWPLLCGRDGRQSHGAPVPGYHTCTASQTENSHVKKMRKYSRWLSHWFWAKKTNNLNLSPPTSVPVTRNQPSMLSGNANRAMQVARPGANFRTNASCVWRILDKVNSATLWVWMWSHAWTLRGLLVPKMIPWAPKLSHGCLSRSPWPHRISLGHLRDALTLFGGSPWPQIGCPWPPLGFLRGPLGPKGDHLDAKTGFQLY